MCPQTRRRRQANNSAGESSVGWRAQTRCWLPTFRTCGKNGRMRAVQTAFASYFHPRFARRAACPPCGNGYVAPLPPLVAHFILSAICTSLCFTTLRARRAHTLFSAAVPGKSGGGTNFGIPQRQSIVDIAQGEEQVSRYLRDFYASNQTDIRVDAANLKDAQADFTMATDSKSALAWDREAEGQADWLTGSSGLVMNIDVPRNFDTRNGDHDLHASLAYSGTGPLASGSALPAGLDHAVSSFAAGTAYALNPAVAPPLTLPVLPAAGNECAADCARFHCPTCERCEWDPVRGKVKWQRRKGKISGQKLCSRCGQAEGRQLKKIFGW
uniref:Uncharacterized protein n=1 Tax=Mycena chlorophos TaxID=658473 RepID=A0ABQ0M5L6_MYCCL|nr:predicted protein [Mycena chlorophos]